MLKTADGFFATNAYMVDSFYTYSECLQCMSVYLEFFQPWQEACSFIRKEFPNIMVSTIKIQV